MAQIFHPSSNAFSKFSIFGGLLIVAGFFWVAGVVQRSPYVTQAEVVRTQPVQFSHKHHIDGLGIDCRYCHVSVEKSAFAGIPSTEICMNCHSQIWSDSPMLEPVRASYRDNKPIQWTRVHDLPDFAYFNHSIHLNKGIGCSTCHGPVDEMPLMWRQNSLQMEWCLQCHRNPENYVRPRGEVFNMKWKAPSNQKEMGENLVIEYKIQKKTDCNTCHR